MKTYNDLTNEAHAAALRGDHKSAITLYRRAASKRWDCYPALMGLASAQTWQSQFFEALQTQLLASAMFPEQMQDYFVLKTRIKSKIIRDQDKRLLSYTIKALYRLRDLLQHNYFATDFLAEMLLLDGQREPAMELKYHATACNAASSKKLGLDDFSDSPGKLPDFFVIGPQKTATTTLYALLTQSPDVYPAINKELFFFDGPSFSEGIEWYQCHFPAPKGDNHLVTGEATATYFQSPLVPERMAIMVPNAKLIFTLRAPAKRSISSFYMEKRHGREDRNLYEAISSEVEFLRTHPLPEKGHPANYFKQGHKGYVLFSLYQHYLKEYLALFPSDQVKIISSEAMREPEQTVTELCEFLGVQPPLFQTENAERNVGEYPEDEDYRQSLETMNSFFNEFPDLVGEQWLVNP